MECHDAFECCSHKAGWKMDPSKKMHFLLKMGIVQPARLVYPHESKLSKSDGNFCVPIDRKYWIRYWGILGGICG